MTKGKNPNSHRNRPIVGGSQRKIQISDEQWDFLQWVGAGSKAEGARKVIRTAQILSDARLAQAAIVLECEANPEAIKSAIVLECPEIEKGRKKAADLIQELMLGECNLGRDENGLYRIVRVTSVLIPHPFKQGQQLVELRQELASGEIVERKLVGVSEKIQDIEFLYRGLRSYTDA